MRAEKQITVNARLAHNGGIDCIYGSLMNYHALLMRIASGYQPTAHEQMILVNAASIMRGLADEVKEHRYKVAK